MLTKKGKISNFELQTCFIPQMKAENMQNSYSGRKSRIWNKKVTFLIFFLFLRGTATPKDLFLKKLLM